MREGPKSNWVYLALSIQIVQTTGVVSKAMMIPSKRQTTNRDCMIHGSEIVTRWQSIHIVYQVGFPARPAAQASFPLNTDQELGMLPAALCSNSSNCCSNGFGLPLHAACRKPWILTSCLCPSKESLPDTLWQEDIIQEENKFLPTHHSPGFQHVGYNEGDSKANTAPPF